MLSFIMGMAFAAPTHSAINTANFSTVATKSHKDAGEVVVSTSTVSGVSCFKGMAKTDVAPKRLLEVVADIEGAVRWSSAGVTKAKLLKPGSSTIDYYQYLDVPGWTMSSDRFWFLTAKISHTETKESFEWTKLDNGGAHREFYEKFKADNSSAVEPPVNVGAWYFESTGGSTVVTYVVCTDSGGSIPVMVQNAATKKTLPDTVGDVVREARKR